MILLTQVKKSCLDKNKKNNYLMRLFISECVGGCLSSNWYIHSHLTDKKPIDICQSSGKNGDVKRWGQITAFTNIIKNCDLIALSIAAIWITKTAILINMQRGSPAYLGCLRRYSVWMQMLNSHGMRCFTVVNRVYSRVTLMMLTTPSLREMGYLCNLIPPMSGSMQVQVKPS